MCVSATAGIPGGGLTITVMPSARAVPGDGSTRTFDGKPVEARS